MLAPENDASIVLRSARRASALDPLAAAFGAPFVIEAGETFVTAATVGSCELLVKELAPFPSPDRRAQSPRPAGLLNRTKLVRHHDDICDLGKAQSHRRECELAHRL